MEKAADFLPMFSIVLAASVFFAFAAVIVWQLLTGGINLNGLLADKVSGDFSTGRLQLLILSVAAGGVYMSSILSNLGGGLPAPPDIVWQVLAGSQALYVSGKAGPVMGRFISTIFKS